MKLPSILLIFTLLACESNVSPPTEAPGASILMEFGSSGGWCAGGVFYQLTDKHLYKGNANSCYGGQAITYSGIALPDSSFVRANDLLNHFPEYLATRPNTTWGCPGCTDQTAFWVIIRKNGEKETWELDSFNNGLPAEVSQFIQKFAEIYPLLNH